MPLSTDDRKAELVRRKYTARKLAAELGTSHTLAARVIAGDIVHGEKVERLMQRIAQIIGHEVDYCFPVRRASHWDRLEPRANGKKKGKR